MASQTKQEIKSGHSGISQNQGYTYQWGPFLNVAMVYLSFI